MHSILESRKINSPSYAKDYAENKKDEDRRKNHARRTMMNMQQHVKITAENVKYTIKECIKALKGG